MNNCTVRLETLRHVDGIYAEWAAHACFNYSALEGARKTVMIWTRNDGQLTATTNAER